MVWAEIPFISVMNPAPGAHENCRSQMKELIVQNYNHPSICFWGISNEITIGGERPGLLDNLRDLNALAHEMDKTRMTTIAHVSMVPMENDMHHITDVLSYNHYFGWYGGELENNEQWLDKFHALHPDRPLGISEYGSGGHCQLPQRHAQVQGLHRGIPGGVPRASGEGHRRAPLAVGHACVEHV